MTDENANWLFIRGLTRDQRHWGAFPERFAAALGATVLCLDAPGFGTEAGRPSPRSIQAITDDIRRRFLEARGEGRWSVLGISLGGMVTMDWCSRFPGEFEKAVVINSSAADASSLSSRFSRGGFTVLASKVRAPAAAERAVLGVSSNRTGAELDLLAGDWARFYAETPPHKGSSARQAFAATRFRLPKAVQTPLLVLSSKGDRLVSYRCSEAIADRLGAELRVHDSAGHDLPLDDPEWICARVGEWQRG